MHLCFWLSLISYPEGKGEVKGEGKRGTGTGKFQVESHRATEILRKMGWRSDSSVHAINWLGREILLKKQKYAIDTNAFLTIMQFQLQHRLLQLCRRTPRRRQSRRRHCSRHTRRV